MFIMNTSLDPQRVCRPNSSSMYVRLYLVVIDVYGVEGGYRKPGETMERRPGASQERAEAAVASS